MYIKIGYHPWHKGLKGVKTRPKGIPAWNKGLKGSNKPNETSFKKGLVPWNKGKTYSIETRLKISKNRKGKALGDKNPAWKGGISPTNHLIRNSPEYKDWRIAVFQRDRFTCINCGYRSKKKLDIRADHIKPFSLYPELRFDINNGRTLCIPCDLKIGWQLFREANPKKVLITV